jgi:hypothetical protein
MALTREGLVERVLDRYYGASLPEEPAERATALRDIVSEEWLAIPESDRVALAEAFDDSDQMVAFAGKPPHLTDEEAAELDEQAIDGLTHLIRSEIPRA